MGLQLGRRFSWIIYTDKIGPCGLFQFRRDLDVLSNLAQYEVGKAFQVAFVDCLDQLGNNRII